jgi:hypothetical protein
VAKQAEDLDVIRRIRITGDIESVAAAYESVGQLASLPHLGDQLWILKRL